MEKTCNQIVSFIAGRSAYVEILVGPKIQSTLDLDAFTRAFPISPTGNALNVDFGCNLLRFLGIPLDESFTQTAQNQGAPFNDTTAVVFTNLSTEVLELAGSGQLEKVDRYRALLSLYAGGPFSPIMRMKWAKPNSAHVEFLPPSYRRGLSSRLEDDPISPDFLQFCATERDNDDQLHYYIMVRPRIPRHFSALKNTVDRLRLAQRDHCKYAAV